MVSNIPYLSVIIPVFNEQTRLHNLKLILDFFQGKKFSSEIIIVNDGSTDQTLSMLKRSNKRNNFKIISYSKNQGKGQALKQGMIQARGKFRLFMDIDLSTPLN